MPLNSDVIISDTSCLILLTHVDEIDLLKKMANTVFVTPEIKAEFGNKLPAWIEIKEPKDKHYQKILERDLDKGEVSAILLAIEYPGAVLIIDELKGRKVARDLDLKYSGTLGLILRAKQEGILDSIKPIFDKIRNTNFRFKEDLLKFVLDQAGE